jgi:hypothetical protein
MARNDQKTMTFETMANPHADTCHQTPQQCRQPARGRA